MNRFIILLLPLALIGCAKLQEMGLVKSDKKSLEGEREAVSIVPGTTTSLTATTTEPVELPPAEEVKDWPQAGQNPTHALPHVAVASKVNQVWKTSLGTKSNSRQRLLCEPIIADGTLFIYTPDSFVSAYNTETGKMKWTFFLKPEKKQDALLGGGAAYDNGKLFVSTPFAELFALDIGSGKPLWSVKTSGPLRSAPTIADGRVYVVTINNELTAYDENTGELLWNHAGIMEYAGLLGGSTPSVAQGIVIAPYSSGEVFALRAENGYPVWSESLASYHRTDSFAGMAHIRGRPVIKDNTVYITSNANRTAAFDLRTGEVIWHKDFGGSQTPLVVGNYVYLMTSENQLVCLTRDKGQIRWSKALHMWENEEKLKGRIVWYGPILAGSKLMLTGSHGYLYAITADEGELAYKHKINSNIAVPPIAANGTIYVVTDAGSLIAFR